MLRPLFRFTFAVLMALPAPRLLALGFGPVSNATVLGQTLDLTVRVRLDADESLAEKCVSADVFVGEKRLPADAVQVSLTPGNAPQERRLHIGSSLPITQPVVSVNLVFTCPKHTTHKFVVFVGQPPDPSARSAAPDSAASDIDAAAISIGEQSPQRTAERERVVALEDSLAKLRAEYQATQASLSELQLRMHESQLRSDANLLVLGLAALAAAVGSGLAVLLWQRRAGRRATRPWLDVPATTGQADTAWDARPPTSTVVTAIDEMSTSQMSPSPAQAMAASEFMRFSNQPATEATVEELIDLEQQTEFFIVLGQEDAAIDLLMNQLRGAAGASPLPYLRLLDIFGRRGDSQACSRIRQRFEARFGAQADAPVSGAPSERALSDSPAVIGHLQAVWATPSQAMHAIVDLLFRRDASGSILDLQAYRDLLFLYAVARDLSERQSSPDGVDVLLPIGDDIAPPLAWVEPAAAQPASPERVAGVDIDLDHFGA